MAAEDEDSAAVYTGYPRSLGLVIVLCGRWTVLKLTAALQKNDVYHYHHPGIMVQQKHRPPVREQKKRAGTMVMVQYDGRFVHHQQQP